MDFRTIKEEYKSIYNSAPQNLSEETEERRIGNAEQKRLLKTTLLIFRTIKEELLKS